MTRRAGRIPLRIAVTGTRGKSTVTRLIAASLRADGRRVLAKTTGSKPTVIFPDGREEEILRPGRPTILEQKGILKTAAALRAGALVSELMSVRPEILAVESRGLIRPQVLVITNVRVDHREEMGRTKSEIAGALAAAIPRGATVFVLAEEMCAEFERAAEAAGSRLIAVEGDAQRKGISGTSAFPVQGFEDDFALALCVSDHLDVPREVAVSGLAAARPDFGSLRAWDAVLGDPPATWILVSAFAANDPESSRRALSRLGGLDRTSGGRLVGLLNLRADRGDRTLQWIEALDGGFFSRFAALYVAGAHTGARRWRRQPEAGPAIRPLRANSGEALTAAIVRNHGAGAVLVGLGNMGGLGRLVVEHWEKIGRPHAL